MALAHAGTAGRGRYVRRSHVSSHPSSPTTGRRSVGGGAMVWGCSFKDVFGSKIILPFVLA
jgi:hypothetical protein